MDLTLTPDRIHVVRLEGDAVVPAALLGEHSRGFVSITRTDEELSIAAKPELLPPSVPNEGPFRVLKVVGPLDFSLVGILSQLTEVLAHARVPIFAISTYDTDYILVRESDLERSRRALEQAGHAVRESSNQ